jgi:hypothetical protein
MCKLCLVEALFADEESAVVAGECSEGGDDAGAGGTQGRAVHKVGVKRVRGAQRVAKLGDLGVQVRYAFG